MILLRYFSIYNKPITINEDTFLNRRPISLRYWGYTATLFDDGEASCTHGGGDYCDALWLSKRSSIFGK